MAHHVLDDATKSAMAVLCGFSQNSTFVFTPAGYEAKINGAYIIPPELWPKFTLRPYTVEERMARRRMKIDAASDVKKVNVDDVIKLLMAVCVGWTNLVDPGTGQEIVFGPDKFGHLSDLLIADIMQTADKISGLSHCESLGFGY